MRRTALVSAASVAAMRPGDIIHDSKLAGFGARRQKDAISYFVKLRHHNKQRWVTIGRHGRPTPDGLTWTVDVARQAAVKILGDPTIAERGNQTFATTVDLFDRWFNEHVVIHLKPTTARSYQDTFNAYCRKPLGHIPPAEIDYATLSRIHRDLCETPSAANYVIRTMGSMLSWAAANRLLAWREGNPARGHRMYRETACDRILSVDEIRTFLADLPRAAMDENSRRMMVLELLLGQRSSEISSMARSAVNLSAATWTIVENKSDRPHVVPLPPWSRDLIRTAMDVTNSPFVFPSPVPDPATGNDRPCDAHALSTALRRAQRPISHSAPDSNEKKWVFDFRDAAGLPNPISPHDLRRTCSSYLELLGHGEFVRGAILNHSRKQSVTAKHYSAADLLKLKRTALLQWEAAVRQIIAGHNPFATSLDDDRAEEARILGIAST